MDAKSKELREAAGRLMELAALPLENQKDCVRVWPELGWDGIMLARAYLSEHPEDDGEEITEELLRSLGFLPDGEPPTREYAKRIWSLNEDSDFGDYPAMHVVVNVDDGSTWIEAYAPGGETLAITELAPTNRGQLRQLLKALGITQKQETTCHRS